MSCLRQGCFMKKFMFLMFLLTFPTLYVIDGLFEALYGLSIPREPGDRNLWELAVFLLAVFNICLSFIIAFIVFSLLNIVVIKFFPNKVVTWLEEWQEKSKKSQWAIIWLGSIICYLILLPPLATQTILLVHGSPSESESGSKYKLYEKRQGEAEFLEGIKFYEGTDVGKNMDEAFKWFKKAGENRHKGAQFYLGLMHFNGVGAEKNYEEAFRWYLLSADNGFAAAQNNLGLMYHYGYGVETNTIEALKWYTRAAEKGTDTAYQNLGILYYEGATGVNKNYIKSFIWSTMAQNSGLDRSDFLTHLRTKMPDWHLEKAEVLAEKCWKHKRHINPMQYCIE
jgi:hypothetical protein